MIESAACARERSKHITPNSHARPTPGDVIRIGALLQADDEAAARPGGFSRLERDRELGRRLSGLASQPVAQVMAWEQARAGHGGDSPAPDAGTTVSLACAGLGALVGTATAAGAFFYDGGGRVNVLVLLALFVILPLATLTLAIIGATSRRGLRSLNAGRVGALVARILPAGGTRELAQLAAGARGPRLSKWLMLYWAQWMGLGFSAAALASAMALVLFTDLAFGWSTTLELGPSGVQRLCEALALPWRGVLPAAVPGRELVEASRYFRVVPDQVPGDPALLGRWWLFVVMSMLCYGLLPRIASVVWSRWRLIHACADALLTDPRVHELLDRMNTPLVQTQSPESEQGAAGAAEPLAFAALPRAQGWQVVNWARVPVDTAGIQLALGDAAVLQVHDAGGTLSTSDDEALARRLAGSPAGTGILVLARAFEAPTLELMDFLAALRESAPAAMPVLVLPAAVTDGTLVPPAHAHGVTWREALARTGPPGVRAVALHRGHAG